MLSLFDYSIAYIILFMFLNWTYNTVGFENRLIEDIRVQILWFYFVAEL